MERGLFWNLEIYPFIGWINKNKLSQADFGMLQMKSATFNKSIFMACDKNM